MTASVDELCESFGLPLFLGTVTGPHAVVGQLLGTAEVSTDFWTVGVLHLFFISGTLTGEGVLNTVALLLVSLPSLGTSTGDITLGMVDSASCG